MVFNYLQFLTFLFDLDKMYAINIYSSTVVMSKGEEENQILNFNLNSRFDTVSLI